MFEPPVTAISNCMPNGALQSRRVPSSPWRRRRSLSLTLSVLVAGVVLAVALGVVLIEMRALARDLDRRLVETAVLASQSAADDLASRNDPPDLRDLRDTLHDLLAADPALDVLTIVRADSNEQVVIAVSTSTEERADALALARRAWTSRTVQQTRTARVVIVARPVPRRPNYVAVATVDLDSLVQARQRALRTALEVALPSTLLVTLLVSLLVWWLVGTPVGDIVRTMEAAARGEPARAIVRRPDELGRIADGLNRMLAQLDGINESLQVRIQDATRDLSARNAELAANQHQLLAMRESLAHAERVAALGQVAANVAHQAGTPLNLVSGYVQMLRDDPQVDARVQARLATLDTQIGKVIAVLRTFLDRARPTAGLSPVDLRTVIEQVREIATPRLAQAAIALQLQLEDGLPPVRADVTQLEMAVLNLVTNAIDAMPDGGALTITLRRDAGTIQLQVADTGPGIPTDLLDHLFDAWITTKPAGHGSGLGLAIVRDVMRAHGGSATVSSDSSGACFILTFPIPAMTPLADEHASHSHR